MSNLKQPDTTNYQLIDSGNGRRLERFGANLIDRPENCTLWQPQQPEEVWNQAVARFDGEGQTGWKTTKEFKEPWLFTFHPPVIAGTKSRNIVAELHCGQSKNIGVFPEQAANWTWMSSIIQKHHAEPAVLNLFGYTGIATLVAAAAGANVCHVDASQPALTWARQNQELSGLNNAQIRWIREDCSAFVAREVRRQSHYDAIILDPPAFGRDQKGKVFEFEKRVPELLADCAKLVGKDPLFFIFNGYSMGMSATTLQNLLLDVFPHANIEFGELHLSERGSKRTLPCSIYARFASRR